MFACLCLFCVVLAFVVVVVGTAGVVYGWRVVIVVAGNCVSDRVICTGIHLLSLGKLQCPPPPCMPVNERKH